jgi:hypothetical protein
VGLTVIWFNVLGGLAGKLADAYTAKANAQTDEARIAADVTIAQLQARQAAVIAGGRWIAPVQAAFAVMFLIYYGKLLIWDKVLGLGVTDGLSPSLENLGMIVVGFIFLQSSVDRLRR